jgi:NADPH:quinone reductase-like Zn-dependent oxidoreductase
VGFSGAGTVVDLGSDVESLKSGDQVAYGGSGDAHQAELVAVPVNLVTRVPDGVSLADAATVTLGAIALQGVRRAQAVVGERVGVIGLGILGQLTVQLLKATGCKVLRRLKNCLCRLRLEMNSRMTWRACG